MSNFRPSRVRCISPSSLITATALLQRMSDLFCPLDIRRVRYPSVHPATRSLKTATLRERLGAYRTISSGSAILRHSILGVNRQLLPHVDGLFGFCLAGFWLIARRLFESHSIKNTKSRETSTARSMPQSLRAAQVVHPITTRWPTGYLLDF